MKTNELKTSSEDWEKFFRRGGKYSIRLWYYGWVDSVDVEELYQFFKQRFIEESKDEVDEK